MKENVDSTIYFGVGWFTSNNEEIETGKVDLGSTV